MKLRWTFRAREDVKQIGRFIARDSAQAARAFVARLRQRAGRAARFPRSGRMVPEFKREDLREVIEGNYRIVYRVAKGTIVVLTVFEGHRLLREESVTEAKER